ncbi:hypothetical protein [Streptomyces sp. HPF1205]|uniref:hypothetical protein n=1 Tax=Streptomyces sp. HPF1205 TaxID=2873262 RepID=UPI001CECEDB2|nr:hypothetical protein [Streptomyces sp. HPF1205]
MTTDPTDRLARTVREQVSLGRIVPLGSAGDTSWITESAAVRVLRRACAAMPQARLGAVGLGPADPGTAADAEAGPDTGTGAGTRTGAGAGTAAQGGTGTRTRPGTTGVAPVAGAPMGALPHVPVRIGAAFEAAADEPLPATADRLRGVLWAAARDLLGIAVAAVDLTVTGLLEEEFPVAGWPQEPWEGPAARVTVPDPYRPLEVAALAVPGVAGLTGRLAGFAPGLRVRDTAEPGRPPARLVQVQIAVAPGLVPLRVAREVVTAVTAAAAPGAPGPVTAVVVVTEAE